MLDIIIPTYRNKPGLIKTLQSINHDIMPYTTVTVIDDCSGLYYYNDILEQFPFIRILYNKKNIGPGMTRQYGIESTKEPYITFIDTEDYFINNKIQMIAINTIKDNPNKVIFSWPYLSNNKLSNHSNNRLHGRIYSRAFLKKYHISFCPESSYANEDVGFNRLCRLIIADKKLEVMRLTDPMVVYYNNPNSITRQDNHAFFYNQQNRALSLNIIHIIKIAKEIGLSDNIILDEIDTIMAGLYYTFLCTINTRPEFSEEAWNGTKIFYDNLFKDTPNTAEMLQLGYSKFIKVIFSKKKNWGNKYPINYNRFLNDLANHEKIPNWYT